MHNLMESSYAYAEFAHTPWLHLCTWGFEYQLVDEYWAWSWVRMTIWIHVDIVAYGDFPTQDPDFV